MAAVVEVTWTRSLLEEEEEEEAGEARLLLVKEALTLTLSLPS